MTVQFFLIVAQQPGDGEEIGFIVFRAVGLGYYDTWMEKLKYGFDGR